MRPRKGLQVTVGVFGEVRTQTSLTSSLGHPPAAGTTFLQHCSQYQFLAQVCGRFPLFIVSALKSCLICRVRHQCASGAAFYHRI